MNNRTRGVPGQVGLQGPPGPPCTSCAHDHLPKPVTARHIASGGKRCLHPTDSLVIINSKERVTLVLPQIETNEEFCDDQYYCPCNITIKCLGGNHLIMTTQGKINEFVTSLPLNNGAAKYEFTSVPTGWHALILKSLEG